MKRKDFILNSTAVGLGALLLHDYILGLFEQEISITILHTNDMHSRIEPFPENAGRNANMGGMARRASIIKQVRTEQEHVLLLDSGDIFQGTPYFNFFGGELEFKLMSEMRYDAATFGNHDFDNGLLGLDKMLPHAQFPFLSANYNFDKTIFKNRFAPYKTFQKGPVKIGVFALGIELEGLVPAKLYGETRYEDPIAIAQEMVSQLKKDQCDFIICLSHLGYKYNDDKIDDHKLAEAVSGIDLILGGHTHTFLDKPTLYTNKAGFKTIINQVGWAGINLGRIDVTFSNKKLRNLASAVVPVKPNNIV